MPSQPSCGNLLKLSEWRSPKACSSLQLMGSNGRDQAIASILHTIAPAPGRRRPAQARQDVTVRLRDIAGDRSDLLTKAAGVMLGPRPPDEADPNYNRHDGGAELLLGVAGVNRDDERVQECRSATSGGVDGAGRRRPGAGRSMRNSLRGTVWRLYACCETRLGQ
ncbi:hypothetical protein Airi02_039290 [Actinoallomurus iriomotensis]|uniref:Uncharacterized protein n=1 Tax=Actinoallomurus iriomotensis TaxID=478107 RepID=A0A9W6VZL2_9ACTN|nr:hypothetical protein Airi02_039290 [Actinoallomurus iriomotensis]